LIKEQTTGSTKKEDEEEEELEYKDSQKPKGPLADENISVKICDLGNGCWTHYHFTQRIQTR
jgi:hypothetical protein